MAIKFSATRKQLLELAALAVNSSIPKGRRAYEFENESYNSEDFDLYLLPNSYYNFEQLCIGQYKGRYVNLVIDEFESRENDKIWIFYENKFDSALSTFGTIFTPRKLVEAAGCPIIEEFNLTELPGRFKTKVYLFLQKDNLKKLLKLPNLTFGKKMLDKKEEDLKLKGIEYTYENRKLKYLDYTMEYLIGGELLDKFTAQEIVDTISYYQTENLELLLLEDNENENDI